MPVGVPWDALLGREIGGYRLESLIGVGAAHAVYRGARPEGAEPLPGQPLQPALAVYSVSTSLTPEAAEAARERFLRAGETLSGWRQANLAPLLATGADAESGLLYLVMPYIDGGSLAARMARGPQPLATVSQWAVQLAGAVDALHARGIIHRHIVPSAILLDLRDTLYLSDAGLAGVVDALSGAPPPPTPYTAPEVARFTPATAASDIYSVGAVLYLAVTGQAPSSEATGALVSPLALRPDLPPPVAEAIMRALAADPSARFPSAQAFAEAFAEAFAQGAPVVAAPVAPTPVVAPTPDAPVAPFVGPPLVGLGLPGAGDGYLVTATPPTRNATMTPVTASQPAGGAARRGLPLVAVVALIAVLAVSLGGAYLFAHQRGLPSAGRGGAAHASATSAPAASIAPDSLQILHLGVIGMSDLKTFDPPNVTDQYAMQFTSMVFPGLVVLGANLSPEPWAATALPTVSPDGLTWIFHVRPGLKWSDGVPIDAQDFAFSLSRAESPCGKTLDASYLFAIKDAQAFNSEACEANGVTANGPIQSLIGDSIIIADPLTLDIQLNTPAPALLAAMTFPVAYAVPEQLVMQYGAQYTQHLADGSGFGGDMFKVTRWDHDGALVLTRNDAFWGQKPKLREVDVLFFDDPNTAYDAYQAGQLDVGVAPLPELAAARVHPTFHQVGIGQISYFAMNWQMAPFTDVRMREAFDLALDKAAMASDVLHGAVTATNHIVPSGIPGYNPNLLGPDGTRNVNGNTQQANQLATAYAQAEGCGGGTDFSRCPQVVLMIVVGDQDAANEAAVAQQMWLRAMPNYPIIIDDVDPTVLRQQLNAKQAQLWLGTWSEDYPDPQDWLSTNLTCASPRNAGSACVSPADTLMASADANLNQSARMIQYQQAEQLLVTQVAWIPLCQATVWWETGPHLSGYTLDGTGSVPRAAWQRMYVTRG